jgi:hypothetical protein
MLEELGLRPIVTVPRTRKISTDIQAVRNALAGCWFDAGRCEQGLRHLDGYRRAWDEKRGIWRDRPHHDTASHGADAFRMFAAGYRPPGPVQAMPETVGMDWDPLAL